MRQTKTQSLIIYIVGLLVMLSVLYLGSILDPELRRIGLSAYLRQSQIGGVLLFFGFVFAFPIGLTICFVAGFRFQKVNVRYLLYAVALTAAVANLVLIWPAITGREHSPQYFATVGIILIFLISMSAWLWARQRSSVEGAQRVSADLRGLGYFCFAMATWHCCGVAGLPGFAIHPDHVVLAKSYPFILGQLKVIMLYLIFAWSCTSLAYYLRTKHS